MGIFQVFLEVFRRYCVEVFFALLEDRELTAVCRDETQKSMGQVPCGSLGAAVGFGESVRRLMASICMTVLWTGMACSSVVCSSAVLGQEERLDFQSQVRPILSNYCFACHGFDEEGRAAELRLDLAASALDSQRSVRAIVPHDPQQSEAIRRMESTDPEIQMPPPTANKVMSVKEKEILKRWVEQGANYETHWAFRPIPDTVRVPLARRQGDTGANRFEHTFADPKHPIDAFILEKLNAVDLTPSPRADARTLIRRVYLDLIGTLPDPTDVEEFVADESAEAFDRLVDRLLASPQFGERWGRFWLDQARYADSNGFTIDGARVMWPYRDWVIAAWNADMPFDQFTREQIAGDLIEGGSKSQKIASAFHRNTMINEEGGVKADQYRHEAIIDRVNTTGAVWLGLTVGCAQCHTHKYDPISIDDYYRLYAFFNACADNNGTAPTIDVMEGEVFGLPESFEKDWGLFQALQREEKGLQEKVQAVLADDAVPQLEWKPIDALHAQGRDGDKEIALERLEDGSLRIAEGLAKNSHYHIDFVIRAENETSPITAIRLRTLPDATLPQGGPGTAGNGNFVLSEIQLTRGAQSYSFAKAWADHSQPKFPVGNAIDTDARTGWAINVDAAQVKAKPGLKMNAAHWAVFALSEPLSPENTPIEVHLYHDINENYLIGRFALEYSTSVIPKQDSAPTEELAEVQKRLAEVKSRLPGGGKVVRQMVQSDLEKPPETYRLERGDFLSPDKERGVLKANIPEVFAEGRPLEMRNRLEMANWLVSKENPLTSRVMVNRVWMRLFGTGLVETENDFGFQGAAPTHPELLDWLASHWMQTGWIFKELIRSIVTSATYQQSSRWRADIEQVDVANKWLARQSRIRVDAELVRDQALSAAGVIDLRIGGPSVHPPQPAGVYNFTQTPKAWKEDTGADRYRKTMYTEFFRSAPYPLFTTFDAPDFSNTCTRRSRTNTPLQALAVANDLVFSELAMQLVERSQRAVSSMDVLGEQGEGDVTTKIRERIRWMMQFALCRPPTDRESMRLEDFYRSSKESARQNPGEVSSETMAWFQVARVLLNTDEFLNRE